MHASNIIHNITLVVSVFSTLTLGFILFFHFQNTSQKHNSGLLQIIISLIFADGSVGTCVLVWEVLSRQLEHDALDAACRVFLPIPIMFFIAGYGCMVLVCLRFAQVSQNSSRPSSESQGLLLKTGVSLVDSSLSALHNPPLRVVWATALLLTLPIALLSCLGEDYSVARVIATSSDITYCMFDPTTWLSRGTNFACFQIPLLVTIVINITAFVKGMKALQSAPQSVIAREMKRVGQYLAVLLLVWVPNLVANLMQWLSVRRHDMSFTGDHHDDDDELNVTELYSAVVGVMILLTTLQGLLNAAVYALGHRAFRLHLQTGLSHACGGSLLCCFPAEPGAGIETGPGATAGWCWCCICCGSLGEEDYFSSGRVSEPLLRSFDEDGEPITQNGYKYKVIYSLDDSGGDMPGGIGGGGIGGGGVGHDEEGDDEQPYGSTFFRDKDLLALWQQSQGQTPSRRSGSSGSSSSSQSGRPPLHFPYSPSCSIDPGTGPHRFSKDSLTDDQRLSSVSSVGCGVSDYNAAKGGQVVLGSSGTASTASLGTSLASPLPSPLQEDSIPPLIDDITSTITSGARNRSPFVSIPCAPSGLRSSLKSSLKQGSTSPVGSRGHWAEQRALSDGERSVRFALNECRK